MTKYIPPAEKISLLKNNEQVFPAVLYFQMLNLKFFHHEHE